MIRCLFTSHNASQNYAFANMLSERFEYCRIHTGKDSEMGDCSIYLEIARFTTLPYCIV